MGFRCFGSLLKMRLCKLFWAIRSLILKPFFGRYGLKSYMGKPLILSGIKNFYFGEKVRIYPGARIESYDGGKIEIGDNVSIGQNFHCTSGKGESLIIGENTTILGNVCITNIDHEYRKLGVFILEQPRLVTRTTIGENSFICYGAMIQAGTVLGKQCIVGANSVVRGHYPDYCVIAGVPAKIIRKYNENTGKWEKYNENK